MDGDVDPDVDSDAGSNVVEAGIGEVRGHRASDLGQRRKKRRVCVSPFQRMESVSLPTRRHLSIATSHR
ncbi:hypothetical protein SAMD00023353_8100080 [Rosellinia necatrix]|uniref:Uncharacterized protein n=1 Tax=Rosellinia necatrix TaxID=77044 RepID=A0A1S8AAT7_ROSNE|nr:hypothetical protein SAMD00023353_8100080 [Rosellinia necatrix]